MNTKDALEEVRSKRDRECLRYLGTDFLIDHEAKKIVMAARHLADRVEALEKSLTTGYDLVAESIAPTKQYDFKARAECFVESAIGLLK